jgi:hypothetical protein
MSLYISNHALRRYLERAAGLDAEFFANDMRSRGYGPNQLRQYLETECGINMDDAYRSILPDRIRRALSWAGGNGSVIIGCHRYVVENYTLITVKPNKQAKGRRLPSPKVAA